MSQKVRSKMGQKIGFHKFLGIGNLFLECGIFCFFCLDCIGQNKVIIECFDNRKHKKKIEKKEEIDNCPLICFKKFLDSIHDDRQ